MKKKILTNIPALLIAATISLPAIAAPAEEMPQQEALKHILTFNPTLRTLGMSAAAEDIAARGASQLGGAEIEGEYMFGSNGADNKWSAGISQSFDWPGAYSARKRAAEARSLVAWMEIEKMRRQTALDARLLMVDGVYNTRRLSVLNLIRDNLDSVARSIDYGYKHGELTILDQKKIRLELFKIDDEINSCHQALTDVNARLRLLAGDSTLNVDLSNYDIIPLHAIDVYYNNADKLPEVISATANAEAELLEGEASRLSRLPSFALGYRHAFEEGAHFNGITASIGLPTWGHNYDKDYRNALAEAQTAQAAISSEQARTLIDKDYSRAIKLQSLMKEYSANVLDEEYVELLMLSYHGGQINVITMIQEVNFFLQADLDYQRNDRDYREALVRLDSYLPLPSMND